MTCRAISSSLQSRALERLQGAVWAVQVHSALLRRRPEVPDAEAAEREAAGAGCQAPEPGAAAGAGQGLRLLGRRGLQIRLPGS